MELKGNYFDGKTSRPYSILVHVNEHKISVLSADKSLELNIPDWDLSECKIESLNASNNVLIKHPSYPLEKMEFTGEHARQMVTLVSQDDDIITQSYQNMMVEHPVRVVLGSLLVLTIVSYFYLAHFSPFLANRIVDIIPQQAEIALGESTMNQATSFMDINEEKSRQLQEFYEACGFTSDYPIELKVIDDEMVNAFAAPGGKIIVFQGIIDKTPSWEALAGLLAHELAHVEERHSIRLLARSASSFLIISALTGDIAGASGLIIENAHKLSELSNSRDYERAADSKGLSYLQNLNIRQEGMIELFEVLLKEQELEMSDNLEFLSTHPLSTNRIKDIEADIQNGTLNYEPEKNSRAVMLWQQLMSANDEQDAQPGIEE